MTQTVPFLDVQYTYRTLSKEFDAAYHRVMDSGQYIGGPELDMFESEFAAYCGTEFAIGVANGLDALTLSLRAMNIGPGDEVIVPANTFIATWLAVSQVGATPVPVDADPQTMGLDVDAVESRITSKTRAIIPVHLYGIPTAHDRLSELRAQYGISIIEDSAQAHGAEISGKRVGSLGDASGFSFYPGKNLGAFGDGGAITTNDPDLAASIRAIANYGATEKYNHQVVGTNSRLDPLQAAFLRIKLAHMEKWTDMRRKIADFYTSELGNLGGLKLPQVPEGGKPVWHLYVVRHDHRDALQAALKEKGVMTALHYPIPNHHSGAYKAEFSGASFPVTERICQTCLSLPVDPAMSMEQAERVVSAIRDVLPKLEL